VVYSATPDSTGTRPLVRSTASRITARFSAGSSEQFSPTVPSMIRPCTPARSRVSIWAAVASRSSDWSLLNWVVTAG